MNDATCAALERLLPGEELGRFPLRGRPELPLAAPGTPERAAEVIRFAARERLTLLPLGSGSRLASGPAPERVDLVLSSAHLRGVVAYEPADGTVTEIKTQEGAPVQEGAVLAILV